MNATVALVNLKTSCQERRNDLTSVAGTEWQTLQLGDFISLRRGYDLPEHQRRDGTVPVMGAAGRNGYHDTAIAKGPGVTLGRSGASYGQAHYCVGVYWPHNTALYVTDFKCNDPLFVYYFLDAFDFNRYNSGGAQPSLNRNFIYPIRICTPIPEEQRRIAEALSDVDALIDVLDKLIVKKHAIKVATMQQLLTGQIRLPGCSAVWPDVELKSVLRVQVGFPFSSRYFTGHEVGARLVKNRDLKSDDEIVYYNGPYRNEFLVRDGDLLVGMDGEFAPCLWTKGIALLNQRIGRIVPTDNFDLVFGSYFLKDPLKRIEDVTSSTTVKHLSHSAVERLKSPLPLIDEQRAIGSVLFDMDDAIAVLERLRDKTKAIKQGMMHELLAGRTRLL